MERKNNEQAAQEDQVHLQGPEGSDSLRSRPTEAHPRMPDEPQEQEIVMEKTNWPAVKAAAFTAIRMHMSVAQLELMAAEGNSTPASGDALALAKARGL